jgi:Ca2+-binding RTX toxin-like protein
VVIGSGGNDKIVIADGKDTTVILGTGDSTVVGGLGNDSITGGLGNSTVSGGGGHDMLHLGGHASDYTTHVGTIATAAIGQPQDEVTTHVIITNTSTGFTTDLTGIQYVQLDGADALIFADSTVEAGVAALYHAAFDRTGEFGGVEYWFDKATAGATLASIAADFTHSAEFAADAALSDIEFITKIYLNTFDRGPDAGGLVYWEQQLQGGATRADLLAAFASVAALNAAGVLHTEATIVGSVTVVQHIV